MWAGGISGGRTTLRSKCRVAGSRFRLREALLPEPLHVVQGQIEQRRQLGIVQKPGEAAYLRPGQSGGWIQRMRQHARQQAPRKATPQLPCSPGDRSTLHISVIGGFQESFVGYYRITNIPKTCSLVLACR